MKDRKLSAEEWETAEFGEIFSRLPFPVPVLSDGAVCPWCGEVHRTVSFEGNLCENCGRGFSFGFPPWGECVPMRPESYVNVPWKELDAFSDKLKVLPQWKPNERLSDIYKLFEGFYEVDGGVAKVARRKLN